MINLCVTELNFLVVETIATAMPKSFLCQVIFFLCAVHIARAECPRDDTGYSMTCTSRLDCNGFTSHYPCTNGCCLTTDEMMQRCRAVKQKMPSSSYWDNYYSCMEDQDCNSNWDYEPKCVENCCFEIRGNFESIAADTNTSSKSSATSWNYVSGRACTLLLLALVSMGIV